MDNTVSKLVLYFGCLTLLACLSARAQDTMGAEPGTTSSIQETKMQGAEAETASQSFSISEKDKAKIKAIFPSRIRMKVTISEDDVFPPLPGELEPGNRFDEATVKSLMPTPPPKNRWYKVPTWFAGEFSYGNTEQYYTKDFADGKISLKITSIPGVTSGRTRGMLVDKQGNIWQMTHGGQIVDPGHPQEKHYFRYEDEILGSMPFT